MTANDLPRKMLTSQLNSAIVPWKNKITLDDMNSDYTLAQAEQSTMSAKVAAYAALRNITGIEKPAKRPGRSAVASRIVRRQAEWRYPALSEPFNGTQDLFTVKPKSWETKERARQNMLLLNHQFDTQINKVKFIDDYVRSNVDNGFAIIRTGWISETRTKVEKVPEFGIWQVPEDDLETVQIISEAIQLATESPKDFRLLPPEIYEGALYTIDANDGKVYYAKILRYIDQKVEQLVRNQPTVEIVDIANFLIDPNCKGDIDKAMYCINTYNMSKAALMDNPNFKNTQYIEESNSTIGVSGPHMVENLTTSDNASGKNRQLVTVTEYWGMWDIEGNGELEPVVVAYVGDLIIRCDRNPYPDGKFPFEISAYMPVTGSVYGEPDAELIADNQRISGALERAMIDIIGRTASGQTAVAKGALDVTNRRKFEQGQDFEFNPLSGSLRDTMQVLTPPEIPQSTIGLYQQQSAVAESMSGIKAFGEGINAGSLGDVATGIKGALDAAARREVSILRRLSHTLARVGAKIMAMNAVFLSDEEVIRVTNESDNQVTREEDYRTIYRSELSGSFDVSIDITTAEEDNMKAQELAFMLQTMGNTVDQTIALNILADIAELRKMPDLAHKLRTYQPQPDPMQEAEVRKAMAEAALTEAKVKETEAKAAYYSRLADIGSLDLVEQENGTKQARDVEKIKAQAESQQELARTQAALDVGKSMIENGLQGQPKKEQAPQGIDQSLPILNG